MMTKIIVKDTESFKAKVKEMYGDEYSVLGEYKGTTEKVLMRHNKCGTEYECTPTNFIKGRKCRTCNGTSRMNTESFKAKVKEMYGDEYTVLGEYVNNKTHIKMRHNTCGNEYMVKPNYFINNGTRCPYCYGNRKKTIEDLREAIINNNLDNEYQAISFDEEVNKFNIKHLTCNEIFKMTYADFINNKHRCPVCNNTYRKKTQEEFEKEVEDFFNGEYSVVGKYKTNRTPVLVKHNECGTEFEVIPYNLLRSDEKNGVRCPVCKKVNRENINTSKAKKSSKGKKKTDIKTGRKKYTTEVFKEEVYKLVGDEYIVLGDYVDSLTPIKMKHNTNKCNIIFSVVPTYFLNREYRCPSCKPRAKGSYHKLTTEKIIDRVNELVGDEYTIIGDYEPEKRHIMMRHNTCGHEWDCNINTFMNKGRRCPKCARKIGANKRIDDAREKFISLIEGNEEYEMLGDYIDNKTPILMKHIPCGNEWSISPVNFFAGHGCPNCCFKSTSSKEKEILSFIKEILGDKVKVFENHKIIKPYEIDIYVPEYKIGIEFDGLYWHSVDVNPNIDKNYHLNKTKMCEEKGIRLIHIFENEWEYNKDIVKSRLRNLFNKNNNTIYARHCIIKEISNEDKNNFLELNHIQGKDSSSIRLGLYTSEKYYEEEILVSVMTFCKPRKALGHLNTTEYDYELSRFANMLDYSIVGSFSKLLKYFERNYEWDKIITYADIRWSTGNVYENNGFKYLRTSIPSYWYHKSNSKLYHRFKFRKNNLKNLFPNIYDDNKTEKEIMKEAGYHTIYDCGNKVYEYTKCNK